MTKANTKTAKATRADTNPVATKPVAATNNKASETLADYPFTEKVEWHMEEKPLYVGAFPDQYLWRLPSFRFHRDLPYQADYEDDYQGIEVLIETMPDTGGIYRASIRDRSHRYSKPLGDGVYDAFDFSAGEAGSFVDNALEDLAAHLENGDIDLDRELYDYYHRIPDYADFNFEVRMECVSVQQAAKQLGVTESWVRSLVADRTLEAFYYQGTPHILAASVAHLEQLRKKGQPLSAGRAKPRRLEEELTDEQFLKTFQSAGAWFLLANYKQIADFEGQSKNLVKELAKSNPDATESSLKTRVSCVRRIIRSGRGAEAIRKAMTSKSLNTKHPGAFDLGASLLEKYF